VDMNLKTLISKAFFSAQQEMILTLPDRLLIAFRSKSHQRDTDPETGKPFISFYRWLMTPPPPGCGLGTSQYMDAGDIIYHLEKCRMRVPQGDRGPLNDLIEELVKGYGAVKPRGGDRRSGKIKNQSVSTYGLNGSKRSKGGASPAGLAARLAESTDPKIRKEWKAYLEGKHGSVTRAAIACGMIEDANAPLNRLKQNWRKASAKERLAFLRFVRTKGNARFDDEGRAGI
jgi:hypothetical protein